MTNQREAQIDTQLAELWSAANAAADAKRGTIDGLARALGARKNYRTKHTYEWVKDGAILSNDEIVSQAQALAVVEAYDGDPLEGYGAINFSPASYWLAKREQAEAAHSAARAAAAPLEAEYNAAPWSRFFLVNNAGGHIHKDMHCSTCRITTSYSWLPQLSGLSEADAVEAHGAILCTVCFPSAPVEWTNGHEVAAEQRNADKCSASGTYAPAEAINARRRYCKCPSCGYVASITSNGKLRAHKPADAS